MLWSVLQQDDPSYSIQALLSGENTSEKEAEFLPRGYIREKEKAQYFHQEKKNMLITIKSVFSGNSTAGPIGNSPGQHSTLTVSLHCTE